eukprot:3387101-Pyramimonas_sp.AAC.1
MRVRSAAHVINSEGVSVKEKSSLIYLGTQLSADGRSGVELSQRLGAARQDFNVLGAIWSHT